ncbi:MAG: hypothetical protein WCH62_03215, partial [Candidatus Omnitrophota bacterium]
RHEGYGVFSYECITKVLTAIVYYSWALSCFAFFSVFFFDTFFVKDKDVKITYLDYSCLFVCGLLFNPLAYLNALIFLIVPYFFILRYLFYSQMSRIIVFVIGLFIFLTFILCIVDNKIFFKDINQFYTFLEYKPLMWCIILVYLSLWLAKISIILKWKRL